MTSDAVSGEIHIANDVLAELAGYAAMESYGVVGMAARSKAHKVVQLLSRDKLARGVEVAAGSDPNDPIGLHFDEQTASRLAQVAGPVDRLGARDRPAQYWSSRPEKPRTLLECIRSMPSSGTS